MSVMVPIMKHRRRASNPPRPVRADLGLPPGSPVYVGNRKPTEMRLSIIGYDPVGSWTKSARNADELLSYRNPAGVNWINVNGLKDTDAIVRIAKAHKIHPLTVEDILNTDHRPKIEAFDDYLYITLKSISWVESGQESGNPAPSEKGGIHGSIDDPEEVVSAPTAGEESWQSGRGHAAFEQISIILTADTVITFQERSGDSFDPLRRRIEANVGRLRKAGADYLAYGLVDSIVDAYFLVLDRIGVTLEEFEDRATEGEGRTFVRDLQTVKAELLRIRRAVWPLRESVAALMRLETDLISDELTPFLKDLHDNMLQVAETVESYRDLLAGVLEVNQSSVSLRTNEIMKVLTIISTIFIPLSFIVGVYGMNFRVMPELAWPWGYPAVMLIMAALAGGMLAYFKRKKWM